jgi:hypothetical protein
MAVVVASGPRGSDIKRIRTITEAVLEYSFRWQAVRERHDTLLVHRSHAKAVVHG